MAKQHHQWTFQHQGAFASGPVGPIPEPKLAQLAKAGEIKKNTLVASPTRTKNQWVEAQKYPPLAKMIQEAAAAKEVVTVEATVIEATQVATVSHGGGVVAPEDGKSTSQKDKLIAHLNQFLMTGEQIEFVCMQTKKMALKRDAVVSTNMRFIIAKPKMLGRFEFVDCMWIDLHNAHVKEGILGSTFSIASNAGWYSMEHLAKEDARRIYQIAQDREQAVRWQRRSLEMEERAAGAMQVNINQPAAAQPPVAAQPVAEDPMAKLTKLKQMLDAGLIEQVEFDTAKARILESI